jgi:hypothetical protein
MICKIQVWNEKGMTLGWVYLTHCTSREDVEQLIRDPGGSGYDFDDIMERLYRGMAENWECVDVVEELPPLEEITVVLRFDFILLYVDDERAKHHPLSLPATSGAVT